MRRSFHGRLVVAGIHASLESAAVGQRLLGFMHTAAPRGEKLRAIEAVAEWTLSVARHTRAARNAWSRNATGCAGTCCRTGRTRRPTWQTSWPLYPPCSSTAISAAGTSSLVPGGFTVLDWEDAMLDAPPLWISGTCWPTRSRTWTGKPARIPGSSTSSGCSGASCPGRRSCFAGRGKPWRRSASPSTGLDAGDPLLARRRTRPPRARERDRAVRTGYRASADAVRADRRALALEPRARTRLEQLAALSYEASSNAAQTVSTSSRERPGCNGSVSVRSAIASAFGRPRSEA